MALVGSSGPVLVGLKPKCCVMVMKCQSYQPTSSVFASVNSRMAFLQLPILFP